MTEVEAKKILDYLFRRFEKQAINIYAKGIWRINHNYCDDLILEYTDFGHIKQWGFLYSASKLQHKTAVISVINTIKINKAFTAKNIVEILFDVVKNNDIIAAVGGIGAHTPFLFKGESPEEVLVKADLEDVA